MLPAMHLADAPITMDAKEDGFPLQKFVFIACMAEKYIPTPGTVRTMDGAKPFHSPPISSVVRMFFVIPIIPELLPCWVWIFVFSRSRGWNRIVEQVPLKEPAKNAFTIGDCTTGRINLGATLNSSFIFIVRLASLFDKNPEGFTLY